MTTMTIETYKTRAGRLELAGIDFAAFAHRPLGPDVLRCLRYMHDVEHHTVCYLRDLLLTPAHRDPEVTSFLSCWVFEELWHGEAIGQVLRAHGQPAGATRIAALRHRRRWSDAAGMTLHQLAAGLAGNAFVAVHMAWGALNEWTTQAGYAQLSRRAGHPVLTELLSRIMKQEGRHIDFYASQATSRLAASREARALTRAALSHFWHPVGAGVMPRAEVAFLTRYLFSGPDGAAAASRIDRRMDRLPGLSGLGLLQGALAHYASPLRERSSRAARSARGPDLHERPPVDLIEHEAGLGDGRSERVVLPDLVPARRVRLVEPTGGAHRVDARIELAGRS